MKKLSLSLLAFIICLASFSQSKEPVQTKTKKSMLFLILNPRGIKFVDSRLSPAIFATAGVSFKNSMSVGVGAGYFNNSMYQGSNIPFFFELSILPVKKKINPYIAAKIGVNNYNPSSRESSYNDNSTHLFADISGGILIKVAKAQGIILHGSYTTYNTKGEAAGYYSNNSTMANGFSFGLGLKF